MLRSLVGSEMCIRDRPNLVDKYYTELNPYVDIVGTNKKDKFKISSINNDNLLVEIFHKDDDVPYFKRVIECNIIESINLFGLAKDDEFSIDCTSNHNTSIKIIGGEGQDEIKLLNNKTNIPDIIAYDSFGEDTIEDHSNIKIKRPTRIPHYDPYACLLYTSPSPRDS